MSKRPHSSSLSKKQEQTELDRQIQKRLLLSCLRKEKILLNIERKLYTQKENRFIISTRMPNPKLNHFFNYREADPQQWTVTIKQGETTALDVYGFMFSQGWYYLGQPKYSGYADQYMQIPIPPNFWIDMKHKAREQNSSSQYLVVRNINILKSNSNITADSLGLVPGTRLSVIGTKYVNADTTNLFENSTITFAADGLSNLPLASIFISSEQISNFQCLLHVYTPPTWELGYDPVVTTVTFATDLPSTEFIAPPTGSIFLSETYTGGILTQKWRVPSVAGYTQTFTNNNATTPLYEWPTSEMNQTALMQNFFKTAMESSTTGLGSLQNENRFSDGSRYKLKSSLGQFQLIASLPDGSYEGHPIVLMEWLIDMNLFSYSVMQLPVVTSLNDIISVLDSQFLRVPDNASFPLYWFSSAQLIFQQKNYADTNHNDVSSISTQFDFPDILEPTPILLNSSANPENDSENTTSYNTTFGIYTCTSSNGKVFSLNNESSISDHAHPLRNNFLGVANNSSNGSLQQQQIRLDAYSEIENQNMTNAPINKFTPTQQQPSTNYIRMAISSANGSHANYALLDYSYNMDFGIIFD